MGQNDEYSRDAYYEYDGAVPDLVDDEEDVDLEVHPEDWQDLYSQELLDAWMHLRDYVDQNYFRLKAGFPQFVEFVMDPSGWETDERPAAWQTLVWRSVKNVPVVNERITETNFYAWTNKYVEYF